MDESKDCLPEVADITSQLELLTNSLSESEFESTPISGKSEKFSFNVPTLKIIIIQVIIIININNSSRSRSIGKTLFM